MATPRRNTGFKKIFKDVSIEEILIDELTNSNNWNEISSSYLSTEFIRAFKDKLNWKIISSEQYLENYEIEEFKDYIEWGIFCKYQLLSEDCIRRYLQYVNLKTINEYQVLSKEFRKEFNLPDPILQLRGRPVNSRDIKDLFLCE